MNTDKHTDLQIREQYESVIENICQSNAKKAIFNELYPEVVDRLLDEGFDILLKLGKGKVVTEYHVLW